MMIMMFFVALLAAPSDAFYFRLFSGKKICFPEEVTSSNEVILVDYAQRIPVGSAQSHFETQIEAYSPEQKLVYSTKLTAPNGTFSFRPKTDFLGEYDVCATLLSTVDMVEFALTIETRNKVVVIQDPEPAITRQLVTESGKAMEVMSFLDADGQPKETLRTKAFLDRIHGELVNLQSSIAEARGTVGTFKERVLRFRSTSESTFERVWGMSLITIGVVVLLSVFQYKNLKGFLLKKKLV